ncbi:hypothetical protein EC991_003054 [Linnemannia zychae]|nr:hypothetical protein EC991_003054 [Linnemannia zychae]
MLNGSSEHQDKTTNVQSQVVIIGDKSSGKTRALEAITKLSIPHGNGTRTCYAILVNLKHNATLPSDILSAKIDGEEAFNKRFAIVESSMSISSITQEAVTLLCKGNGISEKVLELSISGPTQSPMTIMDLPGFAYTTDNNIDRAVPEAILSINRRFIKDKRTIILAIVPANSNLFTSTSLSVAREFDPEGERTIPVITKPDRIEDGLLQDWIDVICNRRKVMKLGYLVMRNSGHSLIESSWEESRRVEENFFNSDVWNEVQSHRKGRVAIRQFLDRVLHDHISRELSVLKREIDPVISTLRRETDPVIDTLKREIDPNIDTLKQEIDPVIDKFNLDLYGMRTPIEQPRSLSSLDGSGVIQRYRQPIIPTVHHLR